MVRRRVMPVKALPLNLKVLYLSSKPSGKLGCIKSGDLFDATFAC